MGGNSLRSQKLPRIEPRTGQAQTIRCDAAGFEGSALLRRLLLRFRDARSQKRKGAGNEKKKGGRGRVPRRVVDPLDGRTGPRRTVPGECDVQFPDLWVRYRYGPRDGGTGSWRIRWAGRRHAGGVWDSGRHPPRCPPPWRLLGAPAWSPGDVTSAHRHHKRMCQCHATLLSWTEKMV